MDSLKKGLGLLQSHRREIESLCSEFAVQELAVFGSALGEGFDAESDFDLLVVFDPSLPVGLFHLIRLQQRLEDLLDRKVDLVPKEGLKPRLRDEVLSAARIIYAA